MPLEIHRRRILCWNVRGLEHKQPEFWNFVKKHDVICLVETHLVAECVGRIERHLTPDYAWYLVFAVRSGNGGTPSGGMLLGIKSNKEAIWSLEPDRFVDKWMSTKVLWKGAQEICATFVHRNAHEIQKRHDLGAIRKELDEENVPWVLMGVLLCDEGEGNESRRKELLDIARAEGLVVMDATFPNGQSDSDEDPPRPEVSFALVNEALKKKNTSLEIVPVKSNSDTYPLVLTVES